METSLETSNWTISCGPATRRSAAKVDHFAKPRFCCAQVVVWASVSEKVPRSGVWQMCLLKVWPFDRCFPGMLTDVLFESLTTEMTNLKITRHARYVVSMVSDWRWSCGFTQWGSPFWGLLMKLIWGFSWSMALQATVVGSIVHWLPSNYKQGFGMQQKVVDQESIVL